MAKKVKKIKRLTDQMRGKLILVFIGIICLFFILAVRLTYWTVNKGSEFETKVLGQQKHDSSVIPLSVERFMTEMGISWQQMKRFIHWY